MPESTLREKMEIEITDLKPCHKKAEVTIAAEELESQTTSLVKEFALQASLPGFRTGKAPTALVRKRFATSIDAELLKHIHIELFEKLKDILDSDMVTFPTLGNDSELPKKNEPMKFSVSFDVAPKLDLPEYKGIKIKQPPFKVDPKEVEKEIDQLRTNYAEMEKVDLPIQPEDMLKIGVSSDIECPEDAPESMKRLVNADDTWCWLTEEYEMLPGLLKALKGKKLADVVELDVTFPEDFSEPLLAGSKGHYKITINEIERRIPIKDDKVLCEKLGIKSMKELQERISTNMEQTQKNEARSQSMLDAMQFLLDKLGDFPLPPSLLAQETQQTLSRIVNEMLKTQEDAEKFKENIEEHKKNAEKQAIERLRKFFVAKEIVKKENIEVSQSELDSSITGLSKAYGHDEKKLRAAMNQNGGMEQLHMDMTIRKAMDFLIDNADISETKSQKEKKTTTKSESKAKKTAKTTDKTEKK
jgi:trigger factor